MVEIFPMAQHFLLSAPATSLSISKVARMSDDEAHEAFKVIHWANTFGEPECPPWRIPRQWKDYWKRSR